jgi:hypothetical protein
MLIYKPVRKPFLQVIKTLFCKKFVQFYLIFACYFSIVIYILNRIGFWETSLLKDTIFWVVFAELPLFAKAIEKAKDKHFFINTIKGNLTFVVIVEFLINFWTFDLWLEIIIVPVSVFFGMFYAVSKMKKEYQQVTKFLEKLQIIAGFYVLYNLTSNLFTQADMLFKIEIFKNLLLPFVLLVCTIPIVYGLAMYGQYEQIFFRLKGSPEEKKKMRFSIVKFIGLKLSKATYITDNIYDTLVVSLNDNDLCNNLKRISNKMNSQVGDNYMKRANFLVISRVIILIASLIGLVLCNSEVSIKDLISLNFTLNISRIKEILTYIFATAMVISFFELIYSLGIKKKKYEEVSQLKKIAFHELFYLIKRQFLSLQEYIPIESPDELFINYIQYVYEIKSACDKALEEYEHLFARWEKEVVRSLQTKSQDVILSIGILEEDIPAYSVSAFSVYFMDKTQAAHQNEEMNTFTYLVKSDLDKYTEQIKLAHSEFKHFMK